MKLVILQIKDIKNCEYAFRNYDENKFKLNDYCVEFCGEINDYNKSDNELLEIVFKAFNRVNEDDVKRLEDIGFNGHSLSVSDIVSLDGRNYYCGPFGWKQISL